MSDANKTYKDQAAELLQKAGNKVAETWTSAKNAVEEVRKAIVYIKASSSMCWCASPASDGVATSCVDACRPTLDPSKMHKESLS